MPLNTLTYHDAKSNLRKNRASIFPDGRQKSGRIGVYTNCAIKPNFTFSRDDTIYTTGSCFARNVERVLKGLGFKLAGDDWPMGGSGIMNKYVTRSVLNELKWGLGLEPFPKETLINLGGGKWHDPHISQQQGPATSAKLQGWREQIDGITRGLAKYRIFIMTLGLVETWRDNRENCWLNGIPPASAMNAEPERYSFVRQSYEEILGDLNEIHHILSEHGHPDFKFLITVSPVPFRATHMGQDAIVANMYSKSVLRAAAEAFCQSHDNVDYFPSYEMVVLSDRAVAYIEDNVHIQDAMVDRIMRQVIRLYAPDAEIEETEDEEIAAFGTTGEEVLASARAAIAERQYQLAARLLQKLDAGFNLRHAGIGEFEFHMLHGSVLERLRKTELALREYGAAYRISPANPELNYRMGNILSAKGEESAAAHLKRAVQFDPEEPRYLFALGIEMAKSGRPEEARSLLKRCLRVDPSFVKAKETLADMKRNAAVPA